MPNRSAAKEFNPSYEVQIVPKRGRDGGETWDVVISDSAIQKLAKIAGMPEADLSWSREYLEFMMFELQCQMSNRAPAWRNRIEHLRATRSAARKLEVLLRPKWVEADIRHFEDRELKYQIFGTRDLVHVKTKADAQKARKWMRTTSHLEAVVRDVEAATRMRMLLSSMIDQLERASEEGRLRPPPAGASNPTKQYISDCALGWWMHLGHGEMRSKNFIAFADVIYRLAGFAMSTPAIGAQLTAAVKRRIARSE